MRIFGHDLNKMNVVPMTSLKRKNKNDYLFYGSIKNKFLTKKQRKFQSKEKKIIIALKLYILILIIFIYRCVQKSSLINYPILPNTKVVCLATFNRQYLRKMEIFDINLRRNCN